MSNRWIAVKKVVHEKVSESERVERIRLSFVEDGVPLFTRDIFEHIAESLWHDLGRHIHGAADDDWFKLVLDGLWGPGPIASSLRLHINRGLEDTNELYLRLTDVLDMPIRLRNRVNESGYCNE